MNDDNQDLPKWDEPATAANEPPKWAEPAPKPAPKWDEPAPMATEPMATEPMATAPVATEPVVSGGRSRRLRNNTRAVVVGSLLVGGVAGAAILGPLGALAASPTPTPVATPAPPNATPAAPGATEAPGASEAPETPGTESDNDGKRSGHNEAVSDASVVAKAIGISEAELKTALAGGQTVAQVAAAHNVPLQTVIDALVADGTAELAAEVANGSITQAQADAEKAEILQRATDQANGTLRRGHDGHDGKGGGHNEAVSDTSVVAKAIGISEADLKTALAGGQTVAQVAAAHNVPLQTVIDALVADGTAELAAEVANGSITQAQADAEKAEILQRATDQANGTFGGGRP